MGAKWQKTRILGTTWVLSGAQNDAKLGIGGCWRTIWPFISDVQRHKLRAEVGLFQFQIIKAVEALREKLVDPTPQQPPPPLYRTAPTTTGNRTEHA